MHATHLSEMGVVDYLDPNPDAKNSFEMRLQ